LTLISSQRQKRPRAHWKDQLSFDFAQDREGQRLSTNIPAFSPSSSIARRVKTKTKSWLLIKENYTDLVHG